MSVFPAGVRKLTDLIFSAMGELTALQKALDHVRSDYYGDNPGRVAAAQQNWAITHSYVMGLIIAWETVTGEVWGVERSS